MPKFSFWMNSPWLLAFAGNNNTNNVENGARKLQYSKVVYRLLHFPSRKTRRKEKEGADSSSSSDSKLYLESKVLERKLPEMDMKILVDLPAGLDYNEWLASHSKFLQN